MADFNVFSGDAFSAISMLEGIEKVPYNPSYLGSLGIFADQPVTTTGVWIEERDGVLNLIQTTPRGAPLSQRTTEKRAARHFNTSRVAKGDRLMAAEIANIRAFGSNSELMMAQQEVARRLSGPVGLMREVELTWENMRLGAVQGILTDADSTVLYNWFTEFGISQPSEIAFDLTGANAAGSAGSAGKLRPFIQNNVVRPMVRAAKGSFLPTTKIYGLCSDTFYDDLTNHGEVRQTYLNWLQAQSLRDGNAFEEFPFGGVVWVNYRGTDDGSMVGVAADKVKFFPVGAPGIFRAAWSPAETFDFVNTPGKPIYPMIVPDKDRNAFVDIEVYSYPLHVCTRPEVLFRGRRGS
ncbi:MAG: major capsid protein [Alphaproteobacteria bacterium]|nr:major capsid protein [Alphaproteobacteria bacterium]MBL7097070.1 major capsid protein [Alphaproteobacteria bacterium]